MILEVTGTGTKNKGAELLFIAINNILGQKRNTQLAVSPQFGPYSKRARYGLLQKIESRKLTKSIFFTKLLSPQFRKTYGLVFESEIDGIIDASGFAFGDQLPIATAIRFAENCRRWKSQNKPIVLLPQALGPFESSGTKNAFSSIAKHSDLIFARDSESWEHATNCAPAEAHKILKAPDITIALKPASNIENPFEGKKAVAIVPNSRMLDRINKDAADLYVPYLSKCADYCRNNALHPFLLIHDAAEDHQFIKLIKSQHDWDIPVIKESDPIKLKGILKNSHFVIGSRFHALVGALSSGTPAIALGWTHKYSHLLSDFKCPEMECKIDSSLEHAFEKIKRLNVERDERSKNLTNITEELKNKISYLWEKVFKQLNIA